MSADAAAGDPVASKEPAELQQETAQLQPEAVPPAEAARLPERREVPRFRLRFAVTIVRHTGHGAAPRPALRGRTVDVSIKGASVLLDENLHEPGQATVFLSIPPEHLGENIKIITAIANLSNSVYSPRDGAFRIGLAFSGFEGNGKAQLQAYIDGHCFQFGRDFQALRES